jgi:leucyl aminopeptidase
MPTQLHPLLLAKKTPASRPIVPVHEGNYSAALAKLPAAGKAWLAATGFLPRNGRIALVPDAAGGIGTVLIGVEAPEAKARDPFFASRLPAALPEGDYHFAGTLAEPELAVLSFLLAGYRFTRYKVVEAPKARLALPRGVDGARVSAIAEAVAFGRDLINTPASDLGPDALAREALKLAKAYDAEAKEIAGEKLLKKNYPMIHAVGRAAGEEPRLVDFSWGDARHPKVTLVGKGVCFDTGGLDIKPDAAMLLMKKDMGGAATALAAARMIMGAGLKVQLRVLLPIVENAISATAFRPGDVLTSRKGLSVEIGNTDAEGRLVLADALSRADEEAPDLLLDFATLTGAARVALGQELPPFYTDDEALAAEIAAAGTRVNDPVWRLPLWKNYESIIESKIADINNAGQGGMAGSITAALFLKRFVENAGAYAHFDIYGWALSSRNGLPEGGNPQAARLVFELVQKRWG